MTELIAQVDPRTFWNAPNGSSELYLKIAITLIVGFAAIFGLMSAPSQLRRPLVIAVTFLSGLFYVLFWLYPSPIGREPSDMPRNAAEGVSFWLSDAQSRVADLTNIIAGFLIGLGIYSLLRIHLRRIFKQQNDWFFSAVLITSLVLMTIFGYGDWLQRQSPAGANLPYIASPQWGIMQYGRDLLFDGFLQQMDAGMFSVIAFYILSAAYRAFRARSMEATILLLTALTVMLSFMGLVEYYWNSGINSLAHNDPNSFIQNLRLSEISLWLRNNVQTPAIRGIDFGVGVGLMAMGLRLWLSLEKIGGEA